MMDNPLYPEGESPLIILVVSVMIIASIIPAAFAPNNFAPVAASGPGLLLYSLATFAFSQLAIVAQTGVKTVNLATKYAWVLALLALMFQGTVLLNSYDNVIYQKADKGLNKYILPSYRNIALPIAKFGVTVFDTGVCWYDLGVMAENLAIIDVVKVAVDCSKQDWQLVVNNTFSFVGNTLAIPIYFVQADGNEPFRVYAALTALQDVLNATRPTFECMCEELDFVYDIVFGLATDPNLALGLDAAVNSVLYYPLNITVQALVEIFTNGGSAYNCDQTNSTLRIECVQVRPPYFIPLRTSLCNFTDYAAFWLQDGVNLIISQFIDYDNLLQFNEILSAGVCFPVHFLIDLLDLLSRIDQVFDSEVQYMRHWAFNELVTVGYRYANGVDQFFNGFGDFFTTQIGTIFSNLIVLLANGLNTFQKFVVAVFYTIYDTNSVIDFFEAFNTTQFSVPYYAFKSATFNLTEAINTEFSEVIMQCFTTVEDSFKLVYNLVQMFAQDPSLDYIENWITTEMQAMTDQIFIDMHSVFVTIANFFRQFDTTCTMSPYLPPVIDILDVTNPHTVCQLADIIETIGQFLRSYYITISTTFYELEYNIYHDIPFSGYAPFLAEYGTWLNGDLLIIYTNTIDSISNLIGSLFQDIDCPCVSNQCSSGNEGLNATNVRTNVALFCEALIDGTLGGIYHLAVVTIDVAIDAVDLVGNFNVDTLTQLLCTICQGWMDAIGRFVYILKTFCDFIDCLLGTSNFHINLFTGTIYYVLFDINSASSIRNQLCQVISEAIEAIQFISGIITGGFAYLGALITSGGVTVVNDLVNVINNNLLGALNSGISTLLGGLRTIVCFINRIIGIFQCLSSINISVPIQQFPISIPNFGTPPIHINLGIFSFTIPAIPINIPTFNIPLPIPDFSTITAAITCLTNNINSFSNGGCINTCGPTGAINPSFCTTSVTIPPVPYISAMKKEEKRDFSQFYQPTTFGEHVWGVRESEQENITITTIIGLSNDTLFGDVYNNYTLAICSNYYNLSTDPTLPAGLNAFFLEQFVQCAISAQLSFVVNLAIYQNDTNDWMSPMTFSSVGMTAVSVIEFAAKLYYPFGYELACFGSQIEAKLGYNQSNLATNTCIGWSEYYQSLNLSSQFSYKVGEFLEDLRLNNTNNLGNNTYGWTDLIAGIWDFTSGIYGIIFQIQNGVNSSVFTSLVSSYEAYSNTLGTMTIRSFYDNHVYPVLELEENGVKKWENRNTFGMNMTESLYSGFNRLSNFYNEKKTKVIRVLAANSTRTKRNREKMSYFTSVMWNIYKEYSYKRGVFRTAEQEEKYIKERNEPLLYSAANVDVNEINSIDDAYYAWTHATGIGRDKIMAAMNHHVEVARGKRFSFPPDFFSNSSDICGIPSHSGGTTCINCTILKVLLDDFINRVVECVELSQTNLNLLENRYFKPFIQLIPNPFDRMNSQTEGLFSQWVEEHLGHNFTELSYNYDKQVLGISEGAQTGPDYGLFVTPTQQVADLIDGWIQTLAAWILDIEFSFKLFLNSMRSYITSDISGVENSMYSWLQHYFTIPTTMDCSVLAERGIGIGNLPLTMGLVSLFMIGTIAILSQISYSLLSAFMPVVLLWPMLVLVINYGISPFQTPAVPFCLGDDIFEILGAGNIDCVPITNMLQNITNNYCPDSTTDYERPFLLCSEDPYYFNNPWRLVFFSLDYISPYWMNQLRTSNNYFFTLIREINGMQQMMSFPYTSGDPSAQFISCFFTRIYNFSIFGIYGTVLTAAAVAAALSAVTIITFLGAFTYALGLTAMFIAMGINGSGGMGHTQSNGTMDTMESYLVQNLQGSKAYEKVKVEDMEKEMNMSFSSAAKDRLMMNLKKRSKLKQTIVKVLKRRSKFD